MIVKLLPTSDQNIQAKITEALGEGGDWDMVQKTADDGQQVTRWFLKRTDLVVQWKDPKMFVVR